MSDHGSQVSIKHERKWIITIERLGETWQPVVKPRLSYDTRDEQLLPDIIEATLNAGKLTMGIKVTGLRVLKGGGLGRMTSYYFSTRSDQVPEWILKKIREARVKYRIDDDEALIQAQRKVGL